MPRKKYIVLPIEGKQGKYVVFPLKNRSLVFVAQPRAIFSNHIDIIQAFKKAQQESPEAVFEKYDGYDESFRKINIGRVNKGEQSVGQSSINIRSRSKLVQALEQFARMYPMTDDVEGGGFYQLRKGVFTLYGKSDTYLGVRREVLENFRVPLEKYFRNIENPLERIIIK